MNEVKVEPTLKTEEVNESVEYGNNFLLICFNSVRHEWFKPIRYSVGRRVDNKVQPYLLVWAETSISKNNESYFHSLMSVYFNFILAVARDYPHRIRLSLCRWNCPIFRDNNCPVPFPGTNYLEIKFLQISPVLSEPIECKQSAVFNTL